jgi:hypothetical protein
LNKTGATLRIFVLRRCALRFSGFAIVKVIARARVLADPVLMIQPNVEPDRRIERAMLIEAKPGQLVIKNRRRIRIREITVGHPPIRDRSRDAVNELAHRSFATALVRIGTVPDVAIKIFRDRDLRRQRAPAFRHFDVLLLENHFAAVIGDFRSASFPFDLIKRRHRRVAKHALKTQTAIFLFAILLNASTFLAIGRLARLF